MHVEVDPLLPSGIMQADFALIIMGLFVEQKSEEKTRVDFLAILHSPMNICLMLTCYTLEVL